MAKQRIATISASTVGVHRIVGRDEFGLNIEEKVCPLKGETFIDRDGNEMFHPLENGRIPSPDGERAGRALREELIRDHGELPLTECPYTERYHHLVGGPLVKPTAPDEKDCGGRPDGCEHLRRVQKARRDRAKAAAATRNVKQADAAAAGAIEALGRWAEVQMKTARPITEARGRMREGKGEDAHGRPQE